MIEPWRNDGAFSLRSRVEFMLALKSSGIAFFGGTARRNLDRRLWRASRPRTPALGLDKRAGKWPIAIKGLMRSRSKLAPALPRGKPKVRQFAVTAL